ncbi:MAG: Fic family protein [Phycisphaerae bacterium]
MTFYTPPYTITSEILNLVECIGESLGRLSLLAEPLSLHFRRINRVQTLRGSLAIEGNKLTEEQISAVLDGKNVVAPIKDLQELRNAIKAYDSFMNWNPSSEKDLLDAHKIMTTGLLDLPGRYRKGNVGVIGGGKVVHRAPQAARVPELMASLLTWLGKSDEHPLIKSCVFHYEFEFIHPFDDGNGRIGRLWQTLILSKWNPIFVDIPVESMIYANQQKYYEAIAKSSLAGESTAFIEFMLALIKAETGSSGKHTDQVSDQVNDQVKLLLGLYGRLGKSELSASEMMKEFNLSHRASFRANYLRPAMEAGFIEMTIPQSPQSRLQKYRLTAAGRAAALKY